MLRRSASANHSKPLPVLREEFRWLRHETCRPGRGLPDWGAKGDHWRGHVVSSRFGYQRSTQPIGPANDAPAQLAEFTMRDPILSKINPNIDKLKPNFGETHALINYDVSYVDNMELPVAMEALNVPIPITNPPQPVQTPFPGPRLPYGWVGSAQTVQQFQAATSDFLSDDPALNGLERTSMAQAGHNIILQ